MLSANLTGKLNCTNFTFLLAFGSRMFKTVVSALLCLTLFATAYSCNAARLALVIGNDAYESHAKLKKAGNDADAMATLLKQAGFTVVNDHLRRDLSRSQMNTVFAQLVDRVRVDDEVVVFFSGHGLQYGDNSILTGKDFPKKFGRVLAESEGISLYSWQDKIKRARARFALFIVDACREDVGDGDIRKSLSGSDMAPLIERRM